MENKRKRKSKRRRRQEQRAVILTGFAIVCALIVIVSVQLVLRSYIRKADPHRIIQGVSIGNVEVSGLTAEKAKAKVEEANSSGMDDKLTVQLEDGRSGEVKLSSLGFYVKDLDKVVKEALNYGKKGTAVQCYKILKKAEKNKNEKDFPAFYAVKEKETESSINRAMESVFNLPQNAKPIQENGGVKIAEEKAGEALDVKKTVKNINKFLRTKWDRDGGSVKIFVKQVDPEIKTDDLKEVTDLLGSFTTFYGSDGTGRALNVESGANNINGTLLTPGQEASANAAMEPYTEENGYAMADSYAGDTVVQTMGGGICQVSTTLYNAILYAELEVTQRASHSMLVTYVDPSKDAAIADDVLDLRFKNNLETPIFIEGILEDGNLTFNIYGKETREDGRTLDFISEITKEQMPVGKRFIATEEYIGSYYVKSYAQPAISAQLWKVVYVNGEEQSRDIINYSKYVPAQETIAVGTASDDVEAVKRVTNAIGTQDETAILGALQ